MADVSERRVWRTRRALVATLLIILWVPGCAIAAWWQVTVALGGNDLAYLYSVEWPVFAVLGVVVWWFRVHDDPNEVGTRRFRRLKAEQDAASEHLQRAQVRVVEEEDDDLRAYNEYLAQLSRDAPAKSWRRGRGPQGSEGESTTSSPRS